MEGLENVWAQGQAVNIRAHVYRCLEQRTKRDSVLCGSICLRPRSVILIVMAMPSLERIESRTLPFSLLMCLHNPEYNVINFLEVRSLRSQDQRGIVSPWSCLTNLGRCVKPSPALGTLTESPGIPSLALASRNRCF